MPVVQPADGHDFAEQAWTKPGVAINSDSFDGMSTDAFKLAMIERLESEDLGSKKVNYKLRDWLFSRQRYWGEPFPMVHAADGSVHPLSVADLPVELPHVDDYRPTESGEPPLARAGSDWRETQWNGQTVRRETNTMPQWAGSCWYYLRYMDPHNLDEPFGKAAVDYWQGVDLYVGGVEHAVLHLLYARFWHKVLYDCGLVPNKEPFKKLFNQGMILAYAYRESSGKYHHPESVERRPGDTASIKSAWSHSEVATDWYVAGENTPVEQRLGKMGKSLNNSVDPLEIVESYGADTLRMYEMFMGPLDQVKPWQTSGCEGVRRFLSRAWRLFVDQETGETRAFGETKPEVNRALHVAIRETTNGIEQLKLNTPISRMMEFVTATKGELPSRETCEAFLTLLSPYAPHISEELWSRVGHTTTISDAPWPQFDPNALKSDTQTIVVQVNGKRRGEIEVVPGASKDDVLAQAKALEGIAKFLNSGEIKREIVVPGRLVNLVVA